jgi:hypothetical protein
MRSLIVAAALLASTNCFALSIDLTATINQKINFNYTSKTTLEKNHSLVGGQVIGSVSDGEQFAEVSETIPQQMDTKSIMKLSLVDKHNIRLIDDSDGIDQNVPATIKTKLGKIKSLKITKETYEAIYNKQLAAIGMNIFGQFGVSSSEVDLKISLELSDFDCQKEDDQLVCQQSLSFRITASDDKK